MSYILNSWLKNLIKPPPPEGSSSVRVSVPIHQLEPQPVSKSRHPHELSLWLLGERKSVNAKT